MRILYPHKFAEKVILSIMEGTPFRSVGGHKLSVQLRIHRDIPDSSVVYTGSAPPEHMRELLLGYDGSTTLYMGRPTPEVLRACMEPDEGLCLDRHCALFIAWEYDMCFVYIGPDRFKAAKAARLFDLTIVPLGLGYENPSQQSAQCTL